MLLFPLVSLVDREERKWETCIITILFIYLYYFTFKTRTKSNFSRYRMHLSFLSNAEKIKIDGPTHLLSTMLLNKLFYHCHSNYPSLTSFLPLFILPNTAYGYVWLQGWNKTQMDRIGGKGSWKKVMNGNFL